jgi:hypothetical protein
MQLIDLFESMEHFLYHGTDINNVKEILSSNTISAITEHSRNGKIINGVSLTRDKRYAWDWSGLPFNRCGVVFVLDWKKLKHNKKITQIDYFQNSQYRKRNPIDKTAEAEEFVVGPITPLDRYLVSVEIHRKTWIDFLIQTKDLEQEGLYRDTKWAVKKRKEIIELLTNHPKVKMVDNMLSSAKIHDKYRDNEECYF